MAMTQFAETLNDEFPDYAVKEAKPRTVDGAVKVVMEAFQLSHWRMTTHKIDIHLLHLDLIMAIYIVWKHGGAVIRERQNLNPRNRQTQDYRDEASMQEVYDGDDMLQPALPAAHARDKDIRRPPNCLIIILV